MIKEKIMLKDNQNYYTTYFIDDKERPTVLISAGGGYQYTSPRESEPVALKYAEAGYHVVICNYRETLDFYPVPQENLAFVLNLLKKDKRVGKIIGLGFSAGAHNILEITLHKEKYGNSCVDLLMLAYPVVTSDERYSHMGSFKYLLGDKYGDKEMMEYLSLETQVKPGAPDLFLWGTFTDESVNVMNSLLLLEAYKKAGCNAEYHCFPMGGHGLSLATFETSGGNDTKVNPYIADWLAYSLKWCNEKLKNM